MSPTTRSTPLRPRPLAHHGGLALLATAACTCNSLAGQGAQIEQFGHELVSLHHLDLPGGGPGFELAHLLPSRFFAEPDLQPPRLVCTVDVEGSIPAAGHPGRSVSVSDIGVERIPMTTSGSGMTAAGSPLPGLAGVLAALEGRDAAQGDAARLTELTTADCPQRPRLAEAVRAATDDPPTHWLIRTEIDRANVTEERVSGHRLSSELRRQGDRYLFADGVVLE